MGINGKRGFAAMTQEARREIARNGGKATQRTGKGHKWSSEEAQRAGKKGGQANLGVRKRRRWMVEGAQG